MLRSRRYKLSNPYRLAGVTGRQHGCQREKASVMITAHAVIRLIAEQVLMLTVCGWVPG
jgi:hypothetical protein